MVVRKIFLVFIFAFLLFDASVYGLSPYSTDEGKIVSEQEGVTDETDARIEEIRKEKIDLMDTVSPLREERKKNLHPFVYSGSSTETEGLTVHRAIKGFTPPQSGSETNKTSSSSRNLYSNPVFNLVFFSIVVLVLALVIFYKR